MSIGLWITVILSAWLILGFVSARAYVWRKKGIETPAHTVRKEVYDTESGYYDWKDVDVPAVYIGPKGCMIITAFGVLSFFAIVIIGGAMVVTEAVTNFFNSKAFKNNRVVNAVFGLKG